MRRMPRRSRIPLGGMWGRLAIIVVLLTVGLAPAVAAATPRDTSSTHAYLAADYTALHAVVTASEETVGGSVSTVTE